MGLKMLTNWRSLYPIFPLISASAWASTISFLLVYWLANGRPKFPSQWQPKIAYISDIGGFHLKPFFVIGCVITIATFWVALVRIHFQWFQRLQRLNLTFGRVCSLAAVVSGVAAGLGLILVSVLDVFHFRLVHVIFLHVFCACMLFMATFTIITDVLLQRLKRTDYSNQATITTHGSVAKMDSAELKKVIIYGILASEWVLVIIFVALFAHKFLLVVGILEWVIAYLMVPYLALMGVYMDQEDYLPLQDELSDLDQVGMELSRSLWKLGA